MEIEGIPVDVELVKVQDFADGDICVLKLSELLPHGAEMQMGEALREMFNRAGVQVMVLVLQPGMEIEVLRRAANGDAPKPKPAIKRQALNTKG